MPELATRNARSKLEPRGRPYWVKVARGRALGYDSVHLYTHAKLTQRIGWYERLGFTITHHEDMADRRLTHMRKTFSKAG